MTTDNTPAWDRHAAAHRARAAWSTHVVHYGPDVADEADLRLMGDVAGKRVLEIGCGSGENAVAFARAGAVVFGIDASAQQVALARDLAERCEVRVEIHQTDAADLAHFQPASFDIVFSSMVFGEIEDLDRVFRQVNRVVRSSGLFVFSITHPAWWLPGPDRGERPGIFRSYFDRGEVTVRRGEETFTEHHRTIGDLFSGLHRSGFEIDTLLEPEPTPHTPRSSLWEPAMSVLPRTLVVRARKLGA